MRAVRSEQAAGGVDDLLQHLRGIGDIDDAPRDLVERAVRGHGPLELGGLAAQLLFRVAQLPQQVAVVDCRGRMLGQRAQQ